MEHFGRGPRFCDSGPEMRYRRGAGMMQPKLEFWSRTGGLGDIGGFPKRYPRIVFVDAGFVGFQPEADT